MSTNLYKYSHNPKINMHSKFNYDIFVRFLVVMKNVLISLIKEYRGPTLRSSCDVITMKLVYLHKYFSYRVDQKLKIFEMLMVILLAYSSSIIDDVTR